MGAPAFVIILSYENVQSVSLLRACSVQVVDTRAMAKLFVGNLPWDTEEGTLRELFASCGNVVKCEIPKGRQGRSRGYAIVEFSSPMEASAAVQRLHGARRASSGKATGWLKQC